MFFRRINHFLRTQAFKSADNPETGVARFDDIVDVTEQIGRAHV